MQATAIIRGDQNSFYARLTDGSYLRFSGDVALLNSYDVHTSTGTTGGTADGTIDLSALLDNVDSNEIHHFVDSTGGGFELVRLSDGHMAVVRDNGEIFQFFDDGQNNYDNLGAPAPGGSSPSDGVIDISLMAANPNSVSITRWIDSSGGTFTLTEGTEDTHFITRDNGEVYQVRTTNQDQYDNYDGDNGFIDVTQFASRVGQDDIRQYISSAGTDFSIRGNTGDRGFFIDFAGSNEIMYGRMNSITDYDRMTTTAGVFQPVNSHDGTIDVDAMAANVGFSGVYIFEDSTNEGFNVTQTGEGGGFIVSRDNGEVYYTWAGMIAAADDFTTSGLTGGGVDGRVDVAAIAANVNTHMYVHQFVDSVEGSGFKVEPGPDQSILITRANGDVLSIDPNSAFNGTYDTFSATSNTGGADDNIIDIEFLFQNAGSDDVFRFTPPLSAVCFSDDSMIETPDGPLMIRDLEVGDLVETVDNGPMEVKWLYRRKFSARELRANPHLAPILMRVGSLGKNSPSRDTMVSPGHLMLIRNLNSSERRASEEALVPAKFLVGNEGVKQDVPDGGVTYVHILLDTHQLLKVDGFVSESFRYGKTARDTLLPRIAVREIEEIFPEVTGMRNPIERFPAIRKTLYGRPAKRAVNRYGFSNAR